MSSNGFRWFVATSSLGAALLSAAPASAQDWSGALKGILQVKPNTNSVLGVIKSVSDVSLGQIAAGAEKPGDAEGNVLLYRTSWCGHCKRAAEYMRRNNVAFVERDVEANPSFGAEFKKLGARGVPFIVIGNKTMAGFNETQFALDYAEFRRIQPSAAAEAQAAAVPSTTGGAAIALKSGDTLAGKIAGIQVRTQPTKTAPPLVVLSKADEVIYMGDEQDGFYRVTTSKGEGWVDKLLVRKP